MKIYSALEIKRRAYAIDISLLEMCKRAKIAPSTFFKWKAGKTMLNLRTHQKLVAVLWGDKKNGVG